MGFLLLKKKIFCKKVPLPDGRGTQSVEKPLLKVKLYQKENGKFSPAFFKRRQIPKAEPLAAFRRKRNPIFSRPGREQKEKKRSHELMYQFMTCRPAADDPAPAFCLQNAGLEFPKFLSTAHLRQQITPLCAICQTILSFSTGGVSLPDGRGTPCF